LNPVVVIHTVGGGHNDAIIALSLVWAALLAAKGARAGGGSTLAVTLALSVAALVKVFAVVPLGIWVWSLIRTAPAPERRRVAFRHLGPAGVLALAVSAPFFAGARTLHWVVTTSSVEGWASGPRFVARVARAFGRAVAGHGMGVALAHTVEPAFLVLFGAVLWRVLRRIEPSRAPQDWGVALLVLALALPYLVPWYAAWFVPLLALGADDLLLWIGLGAAGLLALTGVPADPSVAPGLWHSMVLAVHYGIAPIMLSLFLVAARRAARITSLTPQAGGAGG
jgi:alpha-1,6-mannosyltransferase